jgi:hypothetical protein
MNDAGVDDFAEFRIVSQDAVGHSIECCSAETIDLCVSFNGEYYLPDGRPLLDTLCLLQDEVTKLVDEFETELRAAGVI